MSSTATCSRPTIPFPATEYTARLRRLRQALPSEKCDAILVEDALNRLYLTGFPSSNGLLAIATDRTAVDFFTDFRYLQMARAELRFLHCAPVGKAGARYAPLAAAARRGCWRRVGYDGSGSLSAIEQMKKDLPEVTEWVPCQKLISNLRMIKSARELAAIRQAVRVGDAVFDAALQMIRPGMTEWEIRVLIRGLMDAASQGESFDTIVCAGANASRCHHHPSLRPLRRGQELLLDMGVKVDSYCSDLTRVVFYGQPSPRLRELYRIVLEANRRAIAGLRAGAISGDVDALARKRIEDAGYGRFFGHGLGHGVGLEVHDPGSLRAGCKDVLKAGMVVTIEPGIYLPGIGGVRIEDMAVVTAKGCEVLTATPKELLVL